MPLTRLSSARSRSYMLTAMDPNKSPIERAFEIARAGVCRTVDDVRNQLRAEGYNQRQLEGPALGKQIMDIINKARTDAGLTAVLRQGTEAEGDDGSP